MLGGFSSLKLPFCLDFLEPVSKKYSKQRSTPNLLISFLLETKQNLRHTQINIKQAVHVKKNILVGTVSICIRSTVSVYTSLLAPL